MTARQASTLRRLGRGESRHDPTLRSPQTPRPRVGIDILSMTIDNLSIAPHLADRSPSATRPGNRAQATLAQLLRRMAGSHASAGVSVASVTAKGGRRGTTQ